MTTRIDENLHYCEVCLKTFFNSENFTNHMRIHTGNNKSYSCKVFLKKFPITVHMRIHINKHPYPWKSYWKTFFYNSSLKDHMRIYTSENLYFYEGYTKKISYNCSLNHIFIFHKIYVHLQNFVFLYILTEEIFLQVWPYEKIAKNLCQWKYVLISSLLLFTTNRDI